MITSETIKLTQYVIDVDGLSAIINNLKEQGFTVVGPKVEDRAIIYDEIESIEELPQYWQDEQGPGVYRIQKTDNPSYFNYTVGPHSWKKYLHPPQLRLWQAERNGTSFTLEIDDAVPKSYAFLGMRPCEVKAMEIQDRVFRNESYKEPHYDQTRSQSFLFAVNCGRANDTCFCTSMNTGPKADAGYDLCLTEFFDSENHLFLIDVGSERGSTVLEGISKEAPSPEQAKTCDQICENIANGINKKMDTENIRDTLMNNLKHPRWEEVAGRCLACANCTLVCPTCFCTTVEDTTDLTGNHAERWRRWDSCFTMDFSYVAGGHIRGSTKSRYRQWMTHKLASWHDQFDTSGCVGCGRCITWCPVGIDITEEVAAIQSSQK